MTQQRNRKTDRGRSRTTAKHYSRDDIIYLAGSEDLHDREIRSQNKKNNKKIDINTVASHHGDVEPESLIACIVQAADAISAARPGARRETRNLYQSSETARGYHQ